MRFAIALAGFLVPFASFAEEAKPIKALMITGGCCHDYDAQKTILSEGISARAKVEWTIIQEGGKGTKHQVSIYKDPNWAMNYDVIVHNECFATEKDLKHIHVITEAHKAGVPAVMIHCAMHCYQGKTDEWFKLTGVISRNHGPNHAIAVENVERNHPIMKGLPGSWKTPKGELYIIERLWPGTKPLAFGVSNDPRHKNACVWTSRYGKARVFGTTIGHHNETMKEKVYLDMVTAGLLWAVDKLGEDGKPKPGYQAVAAAK